MGATVLSQGGGTVDTTGRVIRSADLDQVDRWAVSCQLSAAGTVQAQDPLGGVIDQVTLAAAGVAHLSGWADVPAIQVHAQAAAGSVDAEATIYGRAFRACPCHRS